MSFTIILNFDQQLPRNHQILQRKAAHVSVLLSHLILVFVFISRNPNFSIFLKDPTPISEEQNNNMAALATVQLFYNQLFINIKQHYSFQHITYQNNKHDICVAVQEFKLLSFFNKNKTFFISPKLRYNI